MKFNFHKGSIRLAGLYLGIMMMVSLFFSLSIYQLSTQELRRGLLRDNPLQNLFPGQSFADEIRDRLQEQRQAQYDDAHEHVVQRLVIVNMLIFILGGVACYYLALGTLKPIEEAHEALERFTADASHELRTPLTVMRSENEVSLMNPKLSLKDAKDQIKSNIEELEKLSTLSEGLLRIASFGNATLEMKEVRPEVIVDKVIDRLLPVAEKKSILIETKISTKSGLRGDESSLVEALAVVVDNAVKYSPSSKKVTIDVGGKDGRVYFRVSDQGLGIKASDLPHIFDRFYRADSARSKPDAGGYGLGLSIAKTIIDKHGGEITVKSRPGKGATFTINIPTNSSLRT